MSLGCKTEGQWEPQKDAGQGDHQPCAMSLKPVNMVPVP